MSAHNGEQKVVLIDPTTMLPYAAGSPFDPASIAALGSLDDKTPAISGKETVAKSQTDQVLGDAGAAGDYLARLLIQPETIAPGSVVLKDGATVIYTYPGSAGYDAGLVPFYVEVGAVATTRWGVTTGDHVNVVAFGTFT